ncbi:hypothetical protein E8E15_009010 [Penicillium rubens]|uniref:Uncharacterized protein n=2 Tax=Penicillium chrysogenum species complex TaxID=254878 RepID=B6GXQ1_PENRW|nr:uncharacterized protein N7525_001411 [Penicillium rubens]KZN85347.1 hypothetical protein EN45_095250 [Penicillium chrysogenum]CAP80799.1 hypothetical protein PCH_Pc12g11720 [Penicillium rubens Wisconsin 54-1255]KAF3025353.1 hypothetical protein E8E15_009010 [Penicillium rubens]KAJ5034604.1 hypothetical protein NUH16_006046 [Penicillium rubens]KAJ5843670.1 hypothetical protein N7525_001411 [Penicillium rubens]
MSATVLTTAAPGSPPPPPPPPPPKKPADRPFLQRRLKKQRAKQAKKEKARALEQAKLAALKGLIPKTSKEDSPIAAPEPKKVRSKHPRLRKRPSGATLAQAVWRYLRKKDT